MPRSHAFGNGRLLVQIDHQGNLRDFSYPIGIFNHLSGRAVRTGVWADGAFAWLDGAGWQRTHSTLSADPLIGQEIHSHAELGIQLTIVEGLVPGENTFFREITIDNSRDTPRAVRILFSHDFRLLESDIGDCAFFDPERGGIVHFKGPVALLCWADGVDQYACGITDFGGLEGTWRDCEDGDLSMNPIAQGSVDSSMRVSRRVEAHGSARVQYRIIASDDLDRLASDPLPPAPSPQTERGSPDPAGAQVQFALLHTQIADTGAILAANDSDIMRTNRANYSYCWMRDGAHIGEILLEQGDEERVERFLMFCERCIGPRPYFLQKYRADGTMGATWHPWTVGIPFQQDETASVVSLVCRTKPTEARWDRLVRKPLDFFLTYRDSRGLPLPSYDLWEERRGIHTHTVATVIRAFRDAHRLEPHAEWKEAADQMTIGLLRHLYDENQNRFLRREEDHTVDAATLHVGLLGVVEVMDPRCQANAAAVEEALWVNSPVGGLARYEGDYYFRQTDAYPGNPWIITTLWLAQHHALSGDPDRARELLRWVQGHLHPTGVLPEQVHAETGEPLSVMPLTWSHAEYLKTLSIVGAR